MSNRHARARPAHPSFFGKFFEWMDAGSSPAMTRKVLRSEIGSRRDSMRAVFVLLATLLLAQGAAAQETVVLAVEGWRQETRADGVTYYRCASRICAAGSVVSYKRQPHRPALTLADFESHHRGLAERNRGTGSVRDARIADPRQRTIEGVRVLQVRREVDWTDGSTTVSIEARLIGSDKSFSLVSDSPRLEWTVNNFDGFLRRLVDIAGIRGG
jgi:hypothetical protein